MKVFIHYEDNDNEELHKTSKITLPVKWVDGPISAVLELFVKTYNGKFSTNQLTEVHIEDDQNQALSNDCIVSDYLSPSSDIYVKHGPAPALSAVTASRLSAKEVIPVPPKSTSNKAAAAAADGLILCRRFGCQKKFDMKLNHDEACCYHRLPPVFHETVKFWACCPDKKAYSWDSFMEIKGCQTGPHTNDKPDQPSVLGGCDVRNGNDGSENQSERLKSIDEFNAERRQGAGAGGAGAGDAIAKMYQIRQALDKAGISGVLFDNAKEKVLEKNNGDHIATLAIMSEKFSTFLTSMATE
mmetsp:Transcript_41301/g.53300  ORF Transcript_41301/g.53300 Transcript_41301/m.53300 type:complete len:299 (+) Transcript_41301:57-953(+)|eukprot:CAMPEP_0114351308 /NCGR_PEP_ID=MMETSP0101-20121206/17086_1 /TAXON_ID=38822 ORGANISM="Pteridomonas danica, Strain PT" /NCGR_SAMPLE_ID=MMETSP0101 /ASSEMBLY_ACC=CAM_ASM_000211 /LENGTH=298 /DNA_ID=CAMNT_0001491119 /DNA_START=25 /DNA_END=921 /DNA_ORIENTATION=-